MDNPNHYKDRWVSSRIVERVKNNLVKTKGGNTYCLEGAMHSGLCRHYKTPQFIIMGFRVRITLNLFMSLDKSFIIFFPSIYRTVSQKNGMYIGNNGECSMCPKEIWMMFRP